MSGDFFFYFPQRIWKSRFSNLPKPKFWGATPLFDLRGNSLAFTLCFFPKPENDPFSRISFLINPFAKSEDAKRGTESKKCTFFRTFWSKNDPFFDFFGILALWPYWALLGPKSAFFYGDPGRFKIENRLFFRETPPKWALEKRVKKRHMPGEPREIGHF